MADRTILQYFEWYLTADAGHWRRTADDAVHLKKLGFNTVWLPPAFKGAGGREDVGYGVYDLYDLGEFDQKGSIPTKYGTREEYLAAVRALQHAGIEVLGDIVLNHKIGADECETVEVAQDADNNRNQKIDGERSISAWTRFTFPGRAGIYSDFTWNRHHFDGIDWDDQRKTRGIYQFKGKSWDGEVDTENGNYDYLMGADLDMSNPDVIEELDRWGAWYLEITGLDGFRLDAVKHIRFSFYTHWLEKLRESTGRELFAVGEYWNPNLDSLIHFLDHSGQVMTLFDVPLHFHFYQASTGNGGYDMRHILDNTLVGTRPEMAVTFVDNHDTQPGQALQSWVAGWFRPLAYALILLREDGIPCVFYGDLYGIPHDGISPVGQQLELLLSARQLYAHGIQTDYFDHFNVIGWTRSGDPAHPGSGLAVIMSDGPGGSKEMCVGAEHAGEVFTDCMGSRGERILIGETGCAVFPVNGGSLSVWIPAE